MTGVLGEILNASDWPRDQRSWRARFWRDALIAGGLAAASVVGTVSLIGGGAMVVEDGAAAVRVAELERALLLSGMALVPVLIGSSWFIARRARDLASMERLNAALSRAMADAVDAERTWIGRNLHDDLGQHTTAMVLLTAHLRSRLEVTAPELAEDAERLAALAEEAALRIRSATQVCLIEWAEGLGIGQAIQVLCNSASRMFDVPVVVRIDEPLMKVELAASGHLIRIASEALHNAVKHGSPERIVVTLHGLGDGDSASVGAGADGARGGWAELSVRAEGVGGRRPERGSGVVAPGSAGRLVGDPPGGVGLAGGLGLGLLIMRARAEAIGGTIELAAPRDRSVGASEEGGGIRSLVRCRFPLASVGVLPGRWRSANHLGQRSGGAGVGGGRVGGVGSAGPQDAGPSEAGDRAGRATDASELEGASR